MGNADRFIFGVVLGCISLTVFVIERRVALLNNTISLRDSTILRMERLNDFRDSIMWKHIEKTDSMHIEAIREISKYY